MPSPPKTGPNSEAELLSLWRSVVDDGYAQGLEDAGDGRGLEVVGQAVAQHARVSLAVNRSFQAMFVRAWSGQSDEPASGAALAAVSLDVSRSAQIGRALVLSPGEFVAEEETTDAAASGPEVVRTGRRYLLAELAVLLPGETALAALFLAERPGRGYCEPPAGEIVALPQPGAAFENDTATVVPSATGPHRLLARNFPEVPIPDHVGQYVELLAGANAGQLRRVVGYEAPDLSASPPVGGVLVLAAQGVFSVSGGAGDFEPGETVAQAVSLATGVVVGSSASWLVLARTSGVFVAGQVVTGDKSGATRSVDAVEESPEMVAEAGTAGWRVVPWSELGISVSNAASPVGGRLPVLDELGGENKVFRSQGEADDAYRRRVAATSDVVTPPAILRRANRVLAPYGLRATLREVGSSFLPGVYFGADHFWNDDFVATTGPVSGTFIPSELVHQVHSDGSIAVGRAVVEFPAAASPPEALGAGAFVGVARARGEIRAGDGLVVGQVSAAEATVASASGGLREEDRWRRWLDYPSFRAFFVLEVVPSDLGDFGLAYDAGEKSGYDCLGILACYDGEPVTTEGLQKAVWQEVEGGRAGGVCWAIVATPDVGA